MNALPDAIRDEAELERLLTTPSTTLVGFFRRLNGDLLILGAAGKMGVSLAGLAARAVAASGVPRRILAVARFSNPEARRQLEAVGAETWQADLLNPDEVARLPAAPNVLFMVGRKFGTEQDTALTWAVNTAAPALAAARYAGSRLVVFSTGCVYPLVSAATGGSREEDPLEPVGEYAQSCVARERVFAHYAGVHGTPMCFYRLNYATDLRYGVLHDIAQRVWAGQPVDLTVGWFNTVWQGWANEVALRALELCAVPPAPLNVTGPELLRTREVAEEFGCLMGRPVTFTGPEGDRNYLNNAARAHALFGRPAVTAERLIRWQAHWIMAGGSTLGKPTQFEVNDGRF